MHLNPTVPQQSIKGETLNKFGLVIQRSLKYTEKVAALPRRVMYAPRFGNNFGSTLWLSRTLAEVKCTFCSVLNCC